MKTLCITRILTIIVIGLLTFACSDKHSSHRSLPVVEVSQIWLQELNLRIAVPKGFVHVDETFPQSVRNFFEAVTPPSNRRLASFIGSDVAEPVRAGGTNRFTRSLGCSILREGENLKLSEAQFKEFQKEFLHELEAEMQQLQPGTVERSINVELKNLYGRSYQIGLGKTTYLPVHEVTDDSVAFSQINPMKNADGKWIVRCGTIITGIVAGRLLYFHVASDFATSDDIEWTQSVASSWFRETKKLN